MNVEAKDRPGGPGAGRAIRPGARPCASLDENGRVRPERPRRPRPAVGPAVLLAALLLALLVLPAVTAVAVAQGPDPAAARVAQGPDPAAPAPWLRLRVSGSPFSPDGDGRREAVTLRLVLDRAAQVRVSVRDFDGRLVRRLLEGQRQPGARRLRWDGRDDAGRTLPAGPYRVVVAAVSDGEAASADTASEGAPGVDTARADVASEVVASADVAGEGAASAEAWVTLAGSCVYPPRPGLIRVALDPGHGGDLPGAVGGDGTSEADLNLDIGLRLAAMLEGAGVGVVLTRTSDAFANDPAVDRTGDGLIDETDELAARPDAANEARADLFISVHNNIAVNPRVGGPSTFYWPERPFADRSARLAELVQEEMLAALRRFRSPGWEPHDHGVLSYPYYVLRGYDPPRLVRPTQMPAVLSEGLFLSHPRELGLLRQRRVRAAMAEAYYEAIAGYLAEREADVGYRLLGAPAEATPGARIVLELEAWNAGNVGLRGWTLHAGVLPAAPFYEGRGRAGRAAGQARLAGLAPGQVRRVRLPVRLPDTSGEWLILVDARDRGGRRAASLGSPMLQVRVTTAAPLEPTATPDPTGAP